MTTTQKIKNNLKSQLNRKASCFSVRHEHGLDGSINVVIKDLTVSKKAVEEIVDEYRHVRVCSVSGDTLGGGNTFTFVDYDDELINNYINSTNIVKFVKDMSDHTDILISIPHCIDTIVNRYGDIFEDISSDALASVAKRVYWLAQK